MDDARRGLDNGMIIQLSDAAWLARESARILGDTPVGAAALASSGRVYPGCNVEHKFRAHDIHAEVNAIGNMVAGGDTHLAAIFIAARRTQFTPCGGCLDWIFEFAGPEAIVLFQSEKGGSVKRYTAGQLMPHYPC